LIGFTALPTATIVGNYEKSRLKMSTPTNATSGSKIFVFIVLSRFYARAARRGWRGLSMIADKRFGRAAGWIEAS
jgi:hypothetical protein